MWTGREIRLPSDSQLPSTKQPKTTVVEYVLRMLEDIRRTHQLARRTLEASHRRQKDYYDRKVFGAPLRSGDKVWFRKHHPDPGIPAKLQHKWKGPYLVERVISGTSCVIRGLGALNGPSMVVHFNQLKPFVQEPLPEVGLELEVPPEGGTARAPGTSLS
jgi:hypothetical protein